MKLETIIQNGQERVILDRKTYDDLVEIRDHAQAMRDIAAGRPTLTADEIEDYLAAQTPVVFWRKRRGKTQAALALEIGVSQPFLAQIETGKRAGTVSVLFRLAKALGVRIEDLVSE